jgi:hypothetical protein
MPRNIHLDRREFLAAMASTVVAAELGMWSAASAQSADAQTAPATNGGGGQGTRTLTPASPKNASFASMKQIHAGVLDVGYAEDGPVDGHGTSTMLPSTARRRPTRIPIMWRS